MTKERVMMLKSHLQRAQINKLTINKSICSFYIIAPKGGNDTVITFNGNNVGCVKKGKIYLDKFDKDVWRNDAYKYEILLGLKKELNDEKDKRQNKGKSVRKSDGK